MCSNCLNKFTMRLQHNRSEFNNKQMIKLQESPDQIPEGETPHTCTLFAYDSSVDTCKPGDRVTVTVRSRLVFCGELESGNPRFRGLTVVASRDRLIRVSSRQRL